MTPLKHHSPTSSIHAQDTRSATAVIIGRAGSKGLPGKNAKHLLGRPLIEYTIEHTLASKHVKRILVSTDCSQIKNAARQFANVEIIDRPAHLASDTATVDSAVRHAIENSKDTSEIIVILYANIPLRPDRLIDRAIERLAKSGADSVQSYAPVGKYHPYWESGINETDGNVIPFFENTVYRRQDLPPLFIPDGGVIAVTRTSLMTVIPDQPHAFLGTDRRAIKTEPGEVVDIDSPIDLMVAEAILRSRAIENSTPHTQPQPAGAT